MLFSLLGFYYTWVSLKSLSPNLISLTFKLISSCFLVIYTWIFAVISNSWCPKRNSLKVSFFLYILSHSVFLATIYLALLKYNWQSSKIFKVYNVMIWYMYTLWKDSSHQVNEHIFHLPCLPFFFGWEHLSSTFLENFSYTIVLSTIVTMLYIRSLDLVFLITEGLYSFINFSLFSLRPSLITTFLLSLSRSYRLPPPFF